MVNQIETGRLIKISMTITPEHINQALARTARETPDAAYLGVLKSIAQPQQESEPKTPAQISSKEKERLENLAAKQKRERWNREHQIGFFRR